MATERRAYTRPMTDQDSIISQLIEKHAQKASMSQYDRAVSITAISAARQVVLAIPSNLPSEEYQARVLAELGQLMERYHDLDGEYTSGKGVIGSLVDDLHYALTRASD